MLTTQDLADAWLAGVLDARALITIQRASVPGIQHAMFARISVAHHSRPLLERINDLAGAGIIITRQEDHARARDFLVWEVSHAEAGAVLRRIRPYLIAQTVAADAALEAQAINAETLASGERGRPSEVTERLEELVRVARAERRSTPGGYKMTPAAVRAIRKARDPQNPDREKLDTLAVRYGVSIATISMIANRKKWAHVADEEASDVP